MEATTATARRDALVERLFGAAVGGFDLIGVYLGDRLGLYDALRAGAMTSGELAAAANIHERYAREWLEQQVMSEVLECDDASARADKRRYSLPPGHDEALTDERSLNFIAPMAQLFVACARPLDAVADAYRAGTGLSFGDYGEDMHAGQGRFTRVMYEHLLAQEWLPAIPAVHARLSADPPARVADVACGIGWSSVAIARGYPKAQVDGIDLDAASIEVASDEVLPGSGVEDRVRFHHSDAADPGLSGAYDLVTIFEALHDMPDPVGALRAARGLLGDEGWVLVMDENVGEAFSPSAGEVERFYYGCSIAHCLVTGMNGDEPAGTGTVMRAGTMRRYAAAAGFAGCEVMPIQNDFYRFYLLTR